MPASQPLPEELKAFDLPAVRSMGIEAAVREAVDHLTREELDGFFIHVDATASTTPSCRLSIFAYQVGCRGAN